MNRELGIARCGLACCLCSDEIKRMGAEPCTGCESGKCAFAPQCKSYHCSKEKGLKGCYECDAICEEGVLGKAKVKGFIAFIQRYGLEAFMDRLEENEKKGVVYHRAGVVGDYDDCQNAQEVIAMLKG
ncbi:MAG: DUF3795 domain-containing protein [Clostridia bacterium]|nr:DUF3795 domain-containing protein [Clostridia bacterium]